MSTERPDRAALRAARADRGWSQAEAARALAALGVREGVPVAEPASLKTLLSRWENGHAVPDAHYRELLGELYGTGTAELGLGERAADGSAAGVDRLRGLLAAADDVDDRALDLWRDQLAVARRLDDRLGTAGAAGVVGALADQLDRTLVHTSHPRRRAAVAIVVADASALAGGQCLDHGDPEASWRRYERALSAGHEAAALSAAHEAAAGAIAEAVAGLAAVRTEIGEAGAAVTLLEGLAPADEPVARVRIAAALGAARAALGDSQGSQEAFDAAEGVLLGGTPGPTRRDRTDRGPARRASRARPGGPAAGRNGPATVDRGRPPPGVTIELADLHRGRGHALAALRDPAAMQPLEHALAAGPASVRDRALLHADLAVTLAGSGRVDDAAQHARTARALARRIGSARVAALLARMNDGRPA